VVLVGVLKGALCFLADLARAITVPVEIDFISLSRFAPDSGRVRILHDVRTDLTGREVVLVEALVDSGLTLAYLARSMVDRGARSVRVCALLDRTSRRIVPHPVDYRGHEVGDGYLIGYGFHHGPWYQNLPAIYVVDAAAAADPKSLVPQVYGAGAGGILRPKEG
jgi:hypoxanthine phosphoribosyltransferase